MLLWNDFGQVVHTILPIIEQYELALVHGHWFSAARKATVGLEYHQHALWTSVGWTSTGSRPMQGRWHPAYVPVEHVIFTNVLHWASSQRNMVDPECSSSAGGGHGVKRPHLTSFVTFALVASKEMGRFQAGPSGLQVVARWNSISDDCQLIADSGRRRLRSANANALTVLRINTRLGDRSFSVAGPKLCNSLPATLRQPDIELGRFRRFLKTFLFS